MQIDHDPRELPHNAFKIAAVIAVVITIAVMIPITLGIRWVIYNTIPAEFALLFCGVVLGVGAGFYIGRWDVARQLRTPGNDG